ncbi:DUF2383 domain-containing protein [Jannaschia sp. Os4]|uniref:DUF2383 domain-containing protein n=1 Tax=Jannaschia sp. Os4 TaxID=2807617 RepID=UPI00193A1FE5|nr:DUF2383 domain-containing protein [Jannaschia sp. Os4]MBM2575200.1 DUF2383 domain-containing protein [Jannaschia sp. Os4]
MAQDALHQINSGIRDVLSGFETLLQKGAPEIMPVATKLKAMHERHAAEVAAKLAALGEDTDDGSVRGTVNKIATTLRDWAGGLDRDALSFVRQGEEMLLGVYDAALDAWDGDADAKTTAERQRAELKTEIAALPAT